MAASFKYNTDQLHQQAIELLSQLIATPSISREEDDTAEIIESYLKSHEVVTHRKGNNIWARNLAYDASKPTILLNSHHDSVKPNAGYTNDPFEPIQKDGKLYGLGSNDAGGALVSLIMTFLYFHNQKDLKYNLLLAATAEEEISGAGGVRSILREIGEVSFGIVGEPTEMDMAVHEKGLMVLDCYAPGQAGHAARNEGENAIYNAISDIEWFRSFKFPKESTTLGPIKMSVTVIEGGTQHNVVPDSCHFVVDVRTTDVYSNEETLEIIRSHVKSEVKERSTRLQPSRMPDDHEIVKAANALDIKLFGSPTMSDQALMPFPTVKIGPGLSDRSHTPDEYIFVEEIREGIMGYLMLLNKLFKSN
ncbi:M20 family metallo-hydrolase [Marinoscillum furvescens]|uniref:Acetylornithine deacetylase n=1 Tax=Marinoscillum furvescens DSM 4134 TaxID=1122208 RepID=A0A3D9L0A6_MARFU|nr:M20 family metallo-hydrolase [Marinoscillum furvescens]RED93202.1 acetylornithine deacetylase [Marinoscillum furvescens DSM 4134]